MEQEPTGDLDAGLSCGLRVQQTHGRLTVQQLMASDSHDRTCRLPLTTKTITSIGSDRKALYRYHREPTKEMVLVVEGIVQDAA